MIHRLATLRQTGLELRCQQWNASIRAGDDFNLVLTVYADDGGALLDVNNAVASLMLTRDGQYPGWGTCDYGAGWWTTQANPDVRLAGVLATDTTTGQITFAMPGGVLGAVNGGMCGVTRYRLAIQIDMRDGEYTQIEGVLQVRPGPVGLTHVAGIASGNPFILDVSQLDGLDVIG